MVVVVAGYVQYYVVPLPLMAEFGMNMNAHNTKASKMQYRSMEPMWNNLAQRHHTLLLLVPCLNILLICRTLQGNPLYVPKLPKNPFL